MPPRAQGPGGETQRLTSVLAGDPGAGCPLRGVRSPPVALRLCTTQGNPMQVRWPKSTDPPPTQSLRGSPGGIWAFTWSLRNKVKFSRCEWSRQGTAGARTENRRAGHLENPGGLARLEGVGTGCVCQNCPGHHLKMFRVSLFPSS